MVMWIGLDSCKGFGTEAELLWVLYRIRRHSPDDDLTSFGGRLVVICTGVMINPKFDTHTERAETPDRDLKHDTQSIYMLCPLFRRGLRASFHSTSRRVSPCRTLEETSPRLFA